MKKLKTVFCATPEIAVPTLKALASHPVVDLVQVVTMPDRPAGRGRQLASPAVALCARELGVDVFQSAKLNDEIDWRQQKRDIDLMVVFAFAQFLSAGILKLPRMGCFNIHTSLLPAYRGAAPIQYALLNGDKETGISIQKMVQKMDAGDVVLAAKQPIAENDCALELTTKLGELAAKSIDPFINMCHQDKLVYIPQDESKVSFAPTIKKSDGLIKFEAISTHTLFNKLKAFTPWPGLYCFLGEKRLKVLEMQLAPYRLGPGEIKTDMGNLVIGCQDKAIRLNRVQLEGKRACRDTELINGYKGPISINP